MTTNGTINSLEDSLKEQIGLALFNKSPAECRRFNLCIVCAEYAGDFRDSNSYKEYFISTMCQDCQDIAFKEPLEEELDY